MGECADYAYQDDTLWCAAYTVGNSNISYKPRMQPNDNLGLDEILYRCRRNENIKTLDRAEAQALKLYMVMVDLFECPAKRIECRVGDTHNVDDILSSYTNFLYFFEHQEYPAPLPFDTHPVIYYAIDGNGELSVKTLMTSMLYDVYYLVPSR